MHTYDIELEYQLPEDKELVDGLVAWGLWGEEERKRKEPHAIHYMEYEVKTPLTKKEALKLKDHLQSTYESGGYIIREIKISERLA